MIKIKTLVFNILQENTYCVIDEDSKESAVIDAGCHTKEEENELEDFIVSNSLNVKYLINTHLHIDHIAGIAFLKEKFHAQSVASQEDIFLLEIMYEQADSLGFSLRHPEKPDQLIEKLKKPLRLGNSEIEFIHVPGHSPGGCAVYLRKENICFTGDTLFREAIGRTDLWGGSYPQIVDSIKNKLYKLPEDTAVYPGHGMPSTIGYEKVNNRYITG
jgi:glyoxylase-like metal-dependent hydrolase (beta-lactamase superfamily II)